MKYALMLAAAVATLLSACGTGIGQSTATAQLAPTAGNEVRGTVGFTERGEGVRVAGEVRGLKPNAEHGFHVHEKGDCSSPDATSAGGHFNPGGSPHGQVGGAAHHAGDMPNLKADASGVARFEFMVPALRVADGPNAVVGRGLVVHRDPDDYRSQPAGNSGARLACAVINRG
jgi:superoxide dismutase, Cu-Zn family